MASDAAIPVGTRVKAKYAGWPLGFVESSDEHPEPEEVNYKYVYFVKFDDGDVIAMRDDEITEIDSPYGRRATDHPHAVTTGDKIARMSVEKNTEVID